MAANKRPPPSWYVGLKPLPYIWALYERGKLIPNVTAYNVETGDYRVKGEPYTYNGPILVKRLS